MNAINVMVIVMIVDMTDNNDFLKFVRQLSFNIYKTRSTSSFKIEDVIDIKTFEYKYIDKVDELIRKGFFFIDNSEDGKYKKTYRIPEICHRTLEELKKDNIHKSVLELIEKQPTILHIEFEKWLKTKHKTMLSYALDKYWHNFMIYSYEYNAWCYDNFGYLIHHIPTPEYEKEESNELNIISDHIEYFKEYRKNYPITKSILLYNFCHKLSLKDIPFTTIKKIIFELVNKVDLEKQKIDSSQENIDNYIGFISGEIQKKGYSVIKDEITLNDYYYICNKLGVIINLTNIEVNDKSNRLFNKASPMPFHTDAHDVDIVSWYCQKQDEVDGQSILVDMNDIESIFSSNEKNSLANMMIKYPIYKRFYVGSHPLYKNKRLYYAPWLKTEYSEEESELLVKLESFIEDKSKIFIRLEKGQSLFVNNYRILHGRNKIQKDSKRLLYRTHIMK